MGLILRRNKGSKLTIGELDGNFEFLANSGTGDISFNGLTMSSNIIDKDITLETKGEGGFVIKNDKTSWVLTLDIDFNQVNNDIWGASITTDDLGNSYTTGGNDQTGRGFIIKTNSVGEIIWQKAISQFAFGESIVYKNNNLYTLFSQVDYRDILIIKLDTDGNLLDQWSIENGFDMTGYEMDIDNYENLYWTGLQYNDNTGSNDILVAKLNTTTSLISWAKTINYDPANGQDIGYSIKVKSNSIYICTSSKIDYEQSSILVMKLNTSNGNIVWDIAITINQDDNQRGNSITVDNNDNIYIVGYKGSRPDNKANFFLKLNSLGSIIWLKSFNFNGQITSIDFNDNSLYIVAESYRDILISRVSTDGDVIWQNVVGTTKGEYLWYYNGHRGIKVDNQIYITGYSEGSMFILAYNRDGMEPNVYGNWTITSATFSFLTPENQLDPKK